MGAATARQIRVAVAPVGFTPSWVARLSQAPSGPIRSECRHMSESEKPLRQQMTEAMEKIRQQVEVLRAGPTMGEPSNNRSLVADLEAEFEALKEARAKLGSEEH